MSRSVPVECSKGGGGGFPGPFPGLIDLPISFNGKIDFF